MTGRLALRTLLAGVTLALLPALAAGQGGPPTEITVTPMDVMFSTPSYLDFDAGWVDHGGITVTVSPRNRNRPWQLHIQAAAADMGGYGKPVQDILFRVQGASTWTPLTTTTQLVTQGSGDMTFTVYLRLLLDWTVDEAGTYSVPFEFVGTSL